MLRTAHGRKRRVQRQMNIIYGNVNMTVYCARCSSCLPKPIPEPRPLPSDTMLASNADALVTDAMPAHLKLMVKDVEQVTKALETASCLIRQLDTSLLSAQCFLTPERIKPITHNFHLVTSKAALKERMTNWRYWEQSGDALWEVVGRLYIEVQVQLENWHQ
jgi:hypothetical protein